MKLLVFSVYDVKACMYGAPIFLNHKGVAIRAFSDVVKDKNSEINKHPSDYNLNYLGSFDNVSGTFEVPDVPEFICSANEFMEN